jgi:hypothetical protein
LGLLFRFITTSADDETTTDGMAELGSTHKLGSKADIRRDGKEDDKERPNRLGVASNGRFASHLFAG